MSTNRSGVKNITLVLQIMQMYHRCIAKYPRKYHYARTSFTARVTVRGMWTARSPRSNWQVAAARRWAGAALARRALHPGTRAHLHTRPGQLGIAQNSGQLWCCSCARCFDGTIIAEPHVSQLLAPGLSPARHSSPLSAAPATTKETSLMAQWLCQKNYQIRAQLVAKMEVSYQLAHGLSISILYVNAIRRLCFKILIQNLQMYAVFQKLNIYTFSGNIIISSEPKIITLNEF